MMNIRMVNMMLIKKPLQYWFMMNFRKKGNDYNVKPLQSWDDGKQSLAPFPIVNCNRRHLHYHD